MEFDKHENYFYENDEVLQDNSKYELLKSFAIEGGIGETIQDWGDKTLEGFCT